MIGGRVRVALLAGVALVSLTGCQLKDDGDNLVNGKTLFVQKCGSCHTLSRVGSLPLSYSFRSGWVYQNIMYAVAGGSDIRCAPYATFGSQELSDHALSALDGRRACLLAHHGMIALGESLASALALAVEVETLAEMYWRALQIREPAVLSDDEMRIVVAKFADYGKP